MQIRILSKTLINAGKIPLTNNMIKHIDINHAIISGARQIALATLVELQFIP